MEEKCIKIKKMKQDIRWFHALYALDDLRSNTNFDDEEFNRLLRELIKYVDDKITEPIGLGEIIDEYVVMEYKEIL